MQRIKSILVVLCVICVFSSPGFAQNNSLSSAFHFSNEASYLGATFSHDVLGINRDKVKLRTTFTYLSGEYESASLGSQSADRFEFGLGIKNTISRDKALFSVFDLAYSYSRSDEPGSSYRDNGTMFAAGFGSRFGPSVSLLGKYVFGRDEGVRLAMEVGF